MSINENKKNYLESNGVDAGTIAWRVYLDGLGFSGNSIVTDTKRMLVDGGYWTGNINESLDAFYADTGTTLRYYLGPDGLDDYVELQSSLAPKLGDTIEIQFIAPTSQLTFPSPIMSGVSNGIHISFETTGVINYNSARVELYLDGDYVTDDVTPYPTDGEHHTLLVVGLGSGTINRFLVNSSLSTFAEITIYDIDINIATGTYFGNLFFPVDDGYTAAGTIRETSQGWDGTGYNITSDAWEYK